MSETLVEISGRLRFFDERIGAYDLRIGRVFSDDERCQRLAKVEGIGPLVATAMVAAVGNAREFKSGRERERQHLRYRPRVDAEPPRRLPPAHPLHIHRAAPARTVPRLSSLRPLPILAEG